MISRTDLNDRVNEWQLRDAVVEKDYVLGWLLWGIGRHPTLSRQWAFKGGTCLKKCYVETFRFSEDLDFTVLPGGPYRPDDVLPALAEVLDLVGQVTGIRFDASPPRMRLRADGRIAGGRVYYIGPRQAPQAAALKLDLNAAERLVRPTASRDIEHPYGDRWAGRATVLCYSFEELVGEKLRALGERCRPRDVYDVVHLLHRRGLQDAGPRFQAALLDKSRAKGLSLPTLAAVTSSDNERDARSEWGNMLAHQLLALPPFESLWRELPAVFRWLNGPLGTGELTSLPLADDEDPAWKPPPRIALWGGGRPVEVARFAIANRLCLQVRDAGGDLLVEPYAIRRTLAGDLRLRAIVADSGTAWSRSFDELGPARVTGQGFAPRFEGEHSDLGEVWGEEDAAGS